MNRINLLVRVPQLGVAYPVTVPRDADPDMVAVSVAQKAELPEKGRYGLKLVGSFDFDDQAVLELIAYAPEDDVVIGPPKPLT